MNNLPSGTVTFLFTDIEGSTKLSQQYRDAMPALLARHNQILHQAIEAHNGYVFQVVGDSFAAGFHSASDALHAALDAQRALQNEAWTPALIKVRMGIHTGAAQLQIDSKDNPYVGYATLASAQRIMSAGHGGQVLLSGATRELVREVLPANTELTDLGEKRLKDLIQPEHIYQLNITGLPVTFPPLKTLDVSLTNLPTQLSTFIGREKEIEQIKERLVKNRLVTLTGSGGVGKTRLSIQVASELLSEYPSGVWLVELAPITDPALVIPTVCAVLDVTPQGNTSPLTVLTDYLRAKKILLVVDNCEHLIDACAQLCDSLLHACSNLRIIASSREALGLDGENAYRVPSLSLPASPHELNAVRESEAVKLFVERAMALLPEFRLTEKNASYITQICQRLDGIALAIELAASRVKILKADQIAARLDDAFRLLTGGSRTALPRQQTLRGTIDWSYQLLSQEEQACLRGLSVFMGGWTLEAAEMVCDNENVLEVLIHLVDKSLVAVDFEHGDESRYFLLETIRQYAREKLAENGEADHIRARHLEYFLTLAQKAEPELKAAGQTAWLRILESDSENIIAALEWSLQRNPNNGQQLAAYLHWYWQLRGDFEQGYAWLQKMLLINTTDETLLRAKLLYAAGQMSWMAGHREAAMAYSKESESLYEKLGNKEEKAFPISVQGWLTLLKSDTDRAFQLFSESLSLHKQAGNVWGILDVTSGFGDLSKRQGKLDQARQYYQESLLLAKEIGDRDKISFELFNIAELAEEQGNYVEAEKTYEEALHYAKESSRPVTDWILNSLGFISLQRRDYERSQRLFEQSLEINQKTGNRVGTASVLNSLGWCSLLQGDFSRAKSSNSAGLLLLKQSNNDKYVASYLIDVGLLLGVDGHPEKFARLLGLAEGLFPDILRTSIPFTRFETERYIKAAQAALGENVYADAYRAGQQMTLDEAVAFALKELEQ